MALRFPCPTCKRELSGPESITGSEVQCPACRTVFLAGKPRGVGAMGIAAERHSPAAPPASRVRGPHRDHLPDEDHPPRPVLPSQGRGVQWFGLIALLVFAPLAFIGIVAWMLMGSAHPTTASPAAFRTTTKTTVSTKAEPPPWERFRIPKTAKSVLLPCASSVLSETKVGDAVVNRYGGFDPESGMGAEVAAIRLPPVQVDDKQLPAWLRDQLLTKLQWPTDLFQDEVGLRGLTKAQGREWYLEKDKDGEPGMIRAYLVDDADGCIIYVFAIHGRHLSRDNWVVRRFFDSIRIEGDWPK